MGIQTSLDQVAEAARILDVMQEADELTVAASRDGGGRAVRLLARAAADPADQLTAVAAIHALAQVFDEAADHALVALLDHDTRWIREHAAWAFGTRLPRFDAVSGLVAMVGEGGFPGMLAQRTLQQWAGSTPDHVALALENALLGVQGDGPRSRLVETVGLVPGRIPERVLLRIAPAAAEGPLTRSAAVAALGDRPAGEAIDALVADIARGDDEVAAVARLAVLDIARQHGDHPAPPERPGLTVVQLFLHADIDAGLTHVGAGDNGGIATLLVRLGDALVDPAGTVGHAPAARDVATTTVPDRPVDRVITLSRGTPDQALASLARVTAGDDGHVFAHIPMLGGPRSLPEAWPHRVEAERGIRRVLRAAGRVDAVHLRMADVGTLAASTVARELGIPVVFTVAPDPHGVVDALDRSGALTRDRFGGVDEREHYWFRVRLVQRLAADAAHTVLFPRPELKRDMRRLVGIDVDAHPERHSVVAEGIDVAAIERSRDDAMLGADADGAPARAFVELDDLLRGLPEERRGLPLVSASAASPASRAWRSSRTSGRRIPRSGPAPTSSSLAATSTRPRRRSASSSRGSSTPSPTRTARPTPRATASSSPATAATTPSRAGSPPSATAAPGSRRRAARTRARASRRSSASRCSRRCRWACPSSRPRPAAPPPTWRTA